MEQIKSGTQPNLTNRILIDNQVYSGNRILEGWENLGQPSNHDYDESFFHQVNKELNEMASQSEDQPDTTLTETSEEGVYRAIYSLQLRTASGLDQIQQEHLRYGSTPLVHHSLELSAGSDHPHTRTKIHLIHHTIVASPFSLS